MSGQYLSLKKLQDEWHKDFVLASKTVVRTEPARVGFALLATAHPCNLDSPKEVCGFHCFVSPPY
jgi:hypothetical protein